MRRIFALLLFLALSPLFIIIIFVLIVFQGRPAIFSQERVGFNFSKFQLYKFRTMKMDYNGPFITVENDPRITRVGKYLRKLKIDEFPQLINVISGDLNFVGPRPEVEKYVNENDFRFLKEIKPGLTDFSSILFSKEENILNKIGGLNEYEKILRIKIDLVNYYIDVRDFSVNLKIILLTFLTLFYPEKAKNKIKKDISKTHPSLVNKITDIGL